VTASRDLCSIRAVSHSLEPEPEPPRPLRVTHALVAVALALLDDPEGQHWGYELSKAAGVRSGVMYPLLTRMLEREWLRDGWEDPNTITDKRRPPRRYYELTDTGRTELGRILQRARSDARFRGMVRRLSW
jgi:PadR family transcriptional regulator